MKYIGSKSKIASEIVPILQNIIDENKIEFYIEPFVGGFNIIDKIKCVVRIGADIDKLVCNLVVECRRNPYLLDTLKTPTREEYYDVRDNPHKYQSWYRAAILLFASYNSRVYGGCYGATAKTKDGKTRDYFEEAKRNFQNQLPKLTNIFIQNCDYRKMVLPKPAKMLFYCDPPYAEGIGYGEGFNTEEFWNWCRERTKEGNIVIVSENYAPKDFACIWEKGVESHLNNRNKTRKTERLFMCMDCTYGVQS